MKRSHNRTLVLLGFWVAVANLIAISVRTHQSTVQLLTTSDRVQRARETTERLQVVKYSLQEAERLAQEFLRTGNAAAQRARAETTRQVREALHQLTQTPAQPPAGAAEMEALRWLASERLAVLDQAIHIGNAQGWQAARQYLDSERSRALAEQINASVDKLLDAEHKALLARDEELRQRAQTSVAWFVLGAFLSLVIFLAVFLYLNIQITARQQAEQALAEEKQLLKKQYQREAALAEIELAINQPHELQTVLDRIARAVTDLLPATGASVILWDPRAEEFVISTTTVPGQAASDSGQRVRRSGGASRWIVEHRQVLMVPDVREDPFGANPMLSEYGLRSYVGVPLLLEGEALGVLYALDKQPRRFRDEEVEFLQSLATRAALAISKVRLYDKLKDINRLLESHVRERTTELINANERLRQENADRQRAERALHELSSRLLQLQDQERRHIARELHDVTAQNLSALTLNLARLEKLLGGADEKTLQVINDSIALAEDCLRDIRTLSYVLHPPMLDEYGLARALEWYLDGFSKRSGIHVDLLAPADIGRLGTDAEMALFRIVQESLTNIRRHSGSQQAAICLRRDNGTITLEVRDSGRGMRLPTGADQARGPVHLGVGIAGMRERLRQLGGKLEIESTTHGTTVRAIVPAPPPSETAS